MLTHASIVCGLWRHAGVGEFGLIPNYVINNIKLEEVKEFKDLGVTYDSLLLFDKHISDKVNKAYMMLGIIKRNFAHLSRKCFIILYKSLVRSIALRQCWVSYF